MATTLGSLILELGLDDSKLRPQFNAVKAKALSYAKELENILKVSPNIDLDTIKPTVDYSDLTQLDTELSYLPTKVNDVNEKFTVVPGVDFTDLDTLNTRLESLRTEEISLDVSDITKDSVEKQTTSDLNSNIKILSKGISKLSSSIEELSEVVFDLNNTMSMIEEDRRAFIDKKVKEKPKRGSKFVLTETELEVLRPEVDHQPLKELNEHLKLKELHFKEVQELFSQKLKPEVDTSDIDDMRSKLEELYNRDIKVNVEGQVKSNNDLKDSIDNLTAAISMSIKLNIGGRKSSSKGLASQLGGVIGDIASAPFKMAAKAAGDIFTGIWENIGRVASDELAQGLMTGIKEELSFTIGSFEFLGEQIGIDLIKGLNNALGRDAIAVENALKDILGQENITREGASVRATSRNRRTTRTRDAMSQLEQEYDIVSNNMPDLKIRYDQAAAQRKTLEEEVKTVQERISDSEKKFGIERQETNLADIDTEIEQLLKTADENKDDPKKFAELTDKLTSLYNRRSNISENIRNIRQRALDVNRDQIDRIKEIDHQLVNIEKDIMREMNAIINYDQLKVGDFIRSENIRASTQVRESNNLSLDTYQKIFTKVGELSGIQNPDISAIPRLSTENMPSGANAVYIPDRNTIKLSPEALQRLLQGNMTSKELETIVHELRHAYQSDLGRQQDTIAIDTVTPTSKEQKILQSRIEASIAGNKGDIALSRQAETDAYVFAYRNTKSVQEDLERSGVAKVSKTLAPKELLSNLQNDIGDRGQRVQELLSKHQDRYLSLAKDLQFSDEQFLYLQEEFDRINKDISEFTNNLPDFSTLSSDEIQELKVQVDEFINSSVDRLKPAILEAKDKGVLRQQNRLETNLGQDPWSYGTLTGNTINSLLDRNLDSSQTQKYEGVPDPWSDTSLTLQDFGFQQNELVAIAGQLGELAGNFVRTIQDEIQLTKATLSLMNQGLQEVNTTLAVISNSVPVKAFVGALTGATQALVNVADISYKMASSVEALVLDITPGGKAAKGILQQTAVPAAMFGATAYMLPGGQAAATGAIELAQSVASPLGSMLGSAGSAQAAEFLSFLPQALGIQSGATAAATEAITIVANGAVNLLAGAGVVIGGGKAIQTGLKSALPTPTNIYQAPQLLPLSKKTPKLEPVTIEVQSSTAETPRLALPSAEEIKQGHQKVLKSAQAIFEPIDVVVEAVKELPPAQQKEHVAIYNIDAINNTFIQLYKNFKELLKGKNIEEIQRAAQILLRSTESAINDIDNLLGELRDSGIDTNFATPLGGKLQGLKGQLRRKQNLINKDLKRQNINTIDVNAEVISEASNVGEQINKALANGMEGNEAFKSGESLGQDAIDGVKKSIDMQSPPRIFTEIGQAIAKALASGMQKAKDLVNKAGKILGKSSIDGTNNSIGETSNFDENVWNFKNAESHARAAYEEVERAIRLADELEEKVNADISKNLSELEDSINGTSKPENLRSRIKRIFDSRISEGSSSGGGGGGGDESEEGIMSFGKTIKQIGAGLVSFFVMDQIVPLFQELASASVDTALAFERIEIKMRFVEGSAVAATEKIRELRAEANKMGVDATATISSYTQYSAAVRDTPLEGSKDTVIKGLMTAQTVMGVNAEDAERMNMAIEQIASKGVVSMEELRQQLGEHLPGAFQIAARSMGLTSAEMNKLVSTGKLLSDEFLPKLFQQVDIELSSGLEEASRSGIASINRLNNAFELFQINIGKIAMPIFIKGVEAATSVLNILNSGLEYTGAAAGVAGLVIIKSFGGLTKTVIAGVVAFAKLFGLQGLLIEFTGLLVMSLSQVQAMLLKLIATISKMALQFVFFHVVLSAAQIGLQYFRDMSGESGKRAREGAKEIAKLKEELSGVGKEATKAAKNLEDIKLRGTAGNFLQEGLFGAINESVKETRKDNDLASNIINAPTDSPFMAMNFVIGRLQKKQIEDEIKAGEELTKNVGDLTIQADVVLNDEQAISEFKRIEELITANRQEQQLTRTFDPGNAELIKKLIEEEKTLYEQRGEAASNIAKVQKIVNSNLERYKQDLEDLKGKRDRGEIDDETFDRRSQGLVEDIAELESLQSRFNKLLNTGTDKFDQMAMAARAMKAATEDAAFAAERIANSQRAVLARTDTGLNTGLVQGTSTAIDQQSIARQLEANRAELQLLQGQLNTTEMTQAIRVLAERIPNFNQLGPQGLSVLRDQMSEAEGDPRLIQSLDNLVNTKLIEGQIDELTAQFEQAGAQLRGQINQLGRQLEDMLIEVGQQTEEIAHSFKEFENDRKVANASNTITRTMGKLRTDHFSGMMNILERFINVIGEQLKSTSDFLKQKMDVMNQLFNTLRQTEQFALSIPQIDQGIIGSQGTNGRNVASPLMGQSIESLVSYKPNERQSFRAGRTRNGRQEYHSGIDWDSRVGGGRGADVAAPFSGTARVIDIAEQEGDRGNAVQVRITTQDAKGIPIDLQFNHLELESVKKALGIGIGESTNVSMGQLVGEVIQHHLDMKVKVNGQFVDAQQWLAAMNAGGGVARNLQGVNVNINPISQPASRTAQSAPQQSGIEMFRNYAPVASRVASMGPGRIPMGGTVRTAERVQSDPAGAQAIVAVARRLGLDPREFAALMSWESAGSFNPNIRGGDNNLYKGLIQFSPENQRKYGTNAQQSIAQQMPAIERYLLDRGFRPGEHDIRHAYSAILAGRAGESYWNRKDSNQTTVRNAAPRFRQGDHRQRAEQFLRDSGIDISGPMSAREGYQQLNDDQFERFMREGYALTQRRDYQSALINFRRAEELRPDNKYATQAISNVTGYINRSRPTTTSSGATTLDVNSYTQSSNQLLSENQKYVDMLQRNADDQIKLIEQMKALADERFDAQIDSMFSEVDREGLTAERNTQDAARQRDREQRDRKYQSIPEFRMTPEIQLEYDLDMASRDIEDRRIDLERQIEDARNDIDAVTQLLQVMPNQLIRAGAKEEDVRRIEAGFREIISQKQPLIDILRKNLADLTAMEGEALLKISEEYKMEEERRYMEFINQLNELTGENLRQQAEMLRNQGNPEIAAELEKQADAADIVQKEKEYQFGLKEQLNAGLDRDRYDQLLAESIKRQILALEILGYNIDRNTEQLRLNNSSFLLEQRAANVEALTPLLNRTGEAGNARDLSYEIEALKIQQDLESQLFDLYEGSKGLTDETRERSRLLIEETAQLKLQTLELEQALQVRADQIEQSRNPLVGPGGVTDLMGAQDAYLGAFGASPTEAMKQERLPFLLDIQRLDYQNAILELEKLKNAGKLTDEGFKAMSESLSKINDIKMDQIRQEASMLPDVIKNVRGPVQGLFSDLMKGTKTVGEAFNDFVNGLIDNLMNLAAEMLTNNLFAGIFGGAAGISSDTGNGIIEMLFGTSRSRSPEEDPNVLMKPPIYNPLLQGAMDYSSYLFPSTGEIRDPSLTEYGKSLFGASTEDTTLTTGAEQASASLRLGGEMVLSSLQLGAQAIQQAAISTQGPNTLDTISGGLFDLSGFDLTFENGAQSIQSAIEAGADRGGAQLGSIVMDVFSGSSSTAVSKGGFSVGGVFQSLLSTVLGMFFKDGGVIKTDTGLGIENFAKGGVIGRSQSTLDKLASTEAIGQALKREGNPRARLAVVSPGEWVLNRRQQAIAKRYGVDENVLNFKNGGVVGGSFSTPAMKAPSGGSTSVTVPITINSDGNNPEKDNRAAKDLSQKVRAAVFQVLTEQKRPNGLLY